MKDKQLNDLLGRMMQYERVRGCYYKIIHLQILLSREKRFCYSLTKKSRVDIHLNRQLIPSCVQFLYSSTVHILPTKITMLFGTIVIHGV